MEVPELPVLAFTTIHVVPASDEDSILYPTMLEPPVDAGAVHESATPFKMPVAVTAVGTPGVVIGFAAITDEAP